MLPFNILFCQVVAYYSSSLPLELLFADRLFPLHLGLFAR